MTSGLRLGQISVLRRQFGQRLRGHLVLKFSALLSILAAPCDLNCLSHRRHHFQALVAEYGVFDIHLFIGNH